MLITVLLAFYIPLTLLDYNHFPYSDGAEHGAAVRELAGNLRHPGDPMLADHPGTSPRFVPSLLLMALFMKLLDLDVLVVLKIFLTVYFLLFLLGAVLFSREYFNDAGQAPWTLICLLVLWGSGWTGANAYMFSALLYTSYFPSVVSFSLSLLALYFQLRFLRTEKAGFLMAYILLGSLLFVNHPFTGVFFFTCSALLYLEKNALNKKTLLCYAASLLAALLLAALWPYSSFLPSLVTIVTGGMAQATDYEQTRNYLYANIALRSGPALLGIPLMALFSLQKRHLLLAGSCALFSLFYLAGYVGTISLAERCIFFIVFTLQMAVSRTCRERFLPSAPPAVQGVRRLTAWVLLPALIMGTGIQLMLVYTKFIAPAFRRTAGVTLPGYVNPNAMNLELREHLGEGDVVLSDIYSSWSIPVYTGAKVIALYHTPPHIGDNTERKKAVETFYDSSTGRETRQEILKRYGVTHLLLDFRTAGKELRPLLREMGLKVVAENETFCLFAVPAGTSSFTTLTEHPPHATDR